MRNLIIFILCFIIISSVISSNEKDMKYHSDPVYYYTLDGPNWALACYFKPGDFGITGYNYKIKIIGFIGDVADGSADIYVTSKEEGGKPICNPDNSWEGKEYGPKSWHINKSYPNYDDCNVYSYEWHYSKDIIKFWCIYNLNSKGYPPYPTCSYLYQSTINSLTWDPQIHYWIKGCPSNPYFNWCIHCVIVYWGTDIESTSLGAVKALFR